MSGLFPISASDRAYQLDRNPNRIIEHAVSLSLPAEPVAAGVPSCVPMGPIGVALSGVAIFNALDAMGRDAPAHEVQDRCGGHPERSGRYHYHDPSACLADAGGGSHSDLVGYALDGFGLYGVRGDNGSELRSADLDTCHGHRHTVPWDGKSREIYHYHMTRDYPYTIGCFAGTAIRVPEQSGGMRPARDGPPDSGGQYPHPPGRRPGPPPR